MADQMDIDQPEADQSVQSINSTTNSNTESHPQAPQAPQLVLPPQQQAKAKKTTAAPNRELTTLTIKFPPFAYVHLSTTTTTTTTTTSTPDLLLDTLQVRSYCTAALRQFLGETGMAIVPDILLIRKNTDTTDCFLRLPREDLAAFAAAMTAFPGMRTGGGGGGGGGILLLRVRACGDYLGSLIGKAEEGDVWGV